MRELHVDIETFSRTSLPKCGAHRYTECPDFELMLFQWSEDDGPVTAVSPHLGEQIPRHVIAALTDPAVVKTGWGIPFERVCLAKALDRPMPAEQWECTMVKAATLGLPLDLDRAGRALKIKMPKLGSSAMRYFCIPCKPTKANGMRTRNLPRHAPEKWADFVEYGIRDVEAEIEILRRCRKVQVDPAVAAVEREMWCLDQRMNDRGVRVDLVLAQNAVALNETFKARCYNEAQELTGLDNPNSVDQLKGWLSQAEGLDVKELNKKIVPQLLKNSNSEVLTRVLQLRLEMAKTSVQKYSAMLNRADEDGFFRGGAQFYGANRTGRWAHRGVQLGNLPKNEVADILLARHLLRENRVEALELLWGAPSFILSQLIRTTFLPDDDDSELLIVDFSAIEARMLAWLADCKWRLDVFKGDGRIYEHSASRAFKVPWSEFQACIDAKKKHPLRFKGKVLELACFPESTMVLCDVGLVPIQNVTTDMRLWDGVEWVRHGGVVARGEQAVIEYCGLEATPDHRVWVEGSNEPVEFGTAKADRARLVRSGQGGVPLWVVGCGGDDARADPSRRLESGVGETQELAYDQRKTRVYDILNAGPRNRFTAGGYLVHNCGYQGGEGALVRMGALDEGLTLEELKPMVYAWRDASPEIAGATWRDQAPGLWELLDEAALTCVRTNRRTEVKHGVEFSVDKGIMFMRLPSGRKLAYMQPRIAEGKFGNPCVEFSGLDQKTNQWVREQGYGGRWAENLSQAASRDVLGAKMVRIDKIPAYRDTLRFTVHDEGVWSLKKGKGSVAELEEIFAEPLPWAPGLPLAGAGFSSPVYMKEVD